MKKVNKTWKKSDIIYICVWSAISVIVLGVILGLWISSANAWKKNWINLPSVMEITLIEKSDNTEYKYELELTDKDNANEIFIEREKKYLGKEFTVKTAVNVKVRNKNKTLIKPIYIHELYKNEKVFMSGIYEDNKLITFENDSNNINVSFGGNHSYAFLIEFVSQRPKIKVDKNGFYDVPPSVKTLKANIYIS